MEVSGSVSDVLEIKALNLAKDQQVAEGAATLSLIESAGQAAPQTSTPSASIGSQINTTA